MTGAGISVSAGIPDFRTKDTGLYANLQKYNLPRPEAIFELDYFKETPAPFYGLAKSFLDLDKFEATPAHHFAKMLNDKKMVSYYLTQNIDNLESKADFPDGDVIQAHGANFGATCSKCKKKQDREKLIKGIQDGEVFYCECGGPVKPDIVFFGEGLPKVFTDVF